MTEKLPVTLSVAARWVIPVDGSNQVLENHSIVVDKGRIIAILPTLEADAVFSAEDAVVLPNHILMPGLINAHAHSAMTLFRGMADDLALMDWLNNHIWPAEGRWVSDQFVADGTRIAIAEMLKSGTTCFNDMYFFPTATARVALEAKIRVSLSFPILDFPTAWANNAGAYINRGLQLHDAHKNHDLISAQFGPHAPYTVSDEPLQKIQMYSVEIDRPIHMHLHETAFEVADAVEKTGKRPLQRMHELGLLSPNFQAVHMTQLTDDDIELLKLTGSHVIHCPESNLKLASGFCPVHKLMQAGVNVALGTDGAASNNDLDMFAEMRTAALLAKAVANDPTALSAEKALEMATINGAKALGLDKITGSLALGKYADMIAVDMSGIESLPLYNPVSQLVYSTRSDKVTDVWVAGKQLLKNRTLLTLNEAAICDNAIEWSAKIKENNATAGKP